MKCNSTFINRSQFSQRTTSGAGSLLVTLLLPVTLLLTACGGGSSGSSSSLSPAEQQLSAFQGQGTSVRGVATANGVLNIRNAEPRQGSVTQSSRYSAGGTGVTLDQVVGLASYNAAGELEMSLENNGENGPSWTLIPNTDIVATRTYGSDDPAAVDPLTLTRSLFLHRPNEDSNEGVIVDFFTDRAGSDDTNYLTGGIWLHIPDTDSRGESDVEIGAFINAINGPNPDNKALPTPAAYFTTMPSSPTASYDGRGLGQLYTRIEYGTSENVERTEEGIDQFFADVDLTLTFDDTTPMVEGRVHRFTDLGDVEELEVPTEQWDNTEIELKPAAVAVTGGELGFFTGEIDDTDLEIEGKWGGQFYGNPVVDSDEHKVAGTFGGTTTNTEFNTDDGVRVTGTFVGFFLATPDDPSE